MAGETTFMVRPTFTSEHLLRQALANLFLRMPGVSDVQILHSQQEYGKDIIFWTRGPLGESLPCACVVKNTEISGSVESNKGARSVCAQAEQALDTPFIDSFGQEQRIHRVYIISPASISQAAMNSIRGRLLQRAGQIVFIPGDRLLELFRLYWLDFFVDEFNSLETHLNQLEQHNQPRELSKVAHLYGIEGPRTEEATIYVTRTLYHALLMYDFQRSTFLPVPDQFKLAQPWRGIDIQEALTALHQFSSSLDHLERWSFLSRGKSEELRQGLRDFSRSLESSWIRAPRDKTHEHGPRELVGLEKLVIQAEDLRVAIFEALRPLEDGCALSRNIINSDLTLDLLATSDALLVCLLEECLRSAPRTLLESTTQRTIRVDESTVRESTIHLLVVGAAGSGKTSFCRWNALLDAQAYRLGKSKVFPIYIPLQSLAQVKLHSFQAAFFRNAGNSALLAEISADSASRIRLYLDGLDEVPSSDQRQHLVELAKQASKAHAALQIIITARDYIGAPWLSWLPKLHLGDLDQVAQEELLSRWFEGSPNLAESFKNQLQKSGSLSELMKVPLLATLILLVFRQTRSLPESRARLYSDFVDLLSGGWDLAKGLLRSSKFGRLVKTMVLSALASKTHTKRVRYFDSRLIGSAIRSVLNDANKNTVLEITGELLVDGIISRSADAFFFSHLSFQEFLCAKQMHGLPTTGKFESVIRSYLAGDDWWREVIKFYISLSENPHGLVEWLFHKLDREEGGRAEDIWKSIETAFPGFSVSSWIDSRLRAARKSHWETQE